MAPFLDCYVARREWSRQRWIASGRVKKRAEREEGGWDEPKLRT